MNLFNLNKTRREISQIKIKVLVQDLFIELSTSFLRSKLDKYHDHQDGNESSCGDVDNNEFVVFLILLSQDVYINKQRANQDDGNKQEIFNSSSSWTKRVTKY